MKIPEPKQQLINEICANGKLEDYRHTIGAILKEINDNGATVSCKYNVTASNIDPSPDRPDHIRISMIQVAEPLNILWVLLHEFGHFLDWPRDENHSIIQREETAWHIAEQELQKYPDLKDHLSSFRKHRAWCLNSYYRHEGLPEISDN